MRSFFRIFLLSAAVYLAVSCDAPRDNPVDPYNPNYKLGTIDGSVRASTGEVLKNVNVLWNNENILVKSDTTGKFKFTGLAMKNGLIYYEKDGLEKESLYVNWNNRKTLQLEEQILYYTIGEINGYVNNKAGDALNGVDIIWKNQNILVQTNSQGYFQIKNVALKNGYLYFKRDGYNYDSTYVDWGESLTFSINSKTLQYAIGQITGLVSDKQLNALQGVKVIWKNQNILVQTDASGHFQINSVNIANGMLYFEKTGFAYDSLYVVWPSGQNSYNVERKQLSYTSGQIYGNVRTLAVPRKGISGVNVFWKNTNTLIQTDASGYFLFSGIPMDNGYVYFEKDGYGKDSVLVSWTSSQQSFNAGEILLNAVPKLNSVSMTTTATYKLGLTDPNYKFLVQASITDADLDIDTVFITNSEFGFTGTLVYNITSKLYERTFYPYNLNLTTTNFGQAVGKLFEIKVKSSQINNNPGKLFSVGSSYIKRIINQEISITRPTNLEATTSTPLLEWTRFNPGFNFTYSIEIGTNDVARTVVWSKSGISDENINILVDSAISAGQYYWIISCIDEYGNRSDSKAGTFIVQ